MVSMDIEERGSVGQHGGIKASGLHHKRKEMPLKPLIETNPYLQDSKVRLHLLAWAVLTSSRIELCHTMRPPSTIRRGVKRSQ